VRPAVVHQQTEFLVRQPLYIQHGITLATSYLTSHPQVEENLIIAEDDRSITDMEDALPDERRNGEPVNPCPEDKLVDSYIS
jgi:hypothetical protein